MCSFGEDHLNGKRRMRWEQKERNVRTCGSSLVKEVLVFVVVVVVFLSFFPCSPYAAQHMWVFFFCVFLPDSILSRDINGFVSQVFCKCIPMNDDGLRCVPRETSCRPPGLVRGNSTGAPMSGKFFPAQPPPHHTHPGKGVLIRSVRLACSRNGLCTCSL